MVTKIQKERKDLAKKGKLLTDEVATAAGIQVASNCSNCSAFHYHRQGAWLACVWYTWGTRLPQRKARLLLVELDCMSAKLSSREVIPIGVSFVIFFKCFLLQG